MTAPLPAPFGWEGDHVGAGLPAGRVLFTTRRGGVSAGPYASLNLGRLTRDDPEAVDLNRERVGEQVGVGWTGMAFAHQVHGADVVRADAPVGGTHADADADGQATARGGLPLLVFVADCLPVALVAAGAVAVVHGGWRGLAGGVVAEGVRALRELGATGPIEAALGPSARGCCYEVGEEVHAVFAGEGARVGARNLALDVVARRRLADAGVGAVHDCGLCTMCEPDLFFSHRRDDGVTGRQAGIVWRA